MQINCHNPFFCSGKILYKYVQKDAEISELGNGWFESLSLSLIFDSPIDLSI
jgi:hypothetical protein